MKLNKVHDEMLACSLLEGERIMVSIRGSQGHALIAIDKRLLLLKPAEGRKVISYEYGDILRLFDEVKRDFKIISFQRTHDSINARVVADENSRGLGTPAEVDLEAPYVHIIERA